MSITLVEHAIRLPSPLPTLHVLAAPGKEPELTDDMDPDRIPFWSVLWDSASALAHSLLASADWHGRHVLELGCGVGAAGLALAAAGAHVTQTDLFPEAMELARRNGRRNGLPHLRHIAADWHRWPVANQWPVVIGSDLLYERQCHADLLTVLDTALTPEGVAYLADPSRPMAADFLSLAARQGWQIATESVCKKQSAPIHLHRLRR